MRIVRFDGGRIGVWTEPGIIDLTDLVPEWTPATAGTAFNLFVERFEDLRATIQERVDLPPAGAGPVRLEAPVWPRQLLAAPRNYKAHQEEMTGFLTRGGGSPADLGFFLKAVGSIAGPGDPIELPAIPERRFDYEGELAFVVGPAARAVPAAQAMDHVFGFTILVDVSMRMTETQREERVMRKSFHSFAPIGPWIVARDEIPDPGALRLRLWINDEPRQDAPVSDLIVDVPGLLAQASSVVTLYPGDVYATGTPSGVGPLVPGDRLRVGIDQIGEMTLSVAERAW